VNLTPFSTIIPCGIKGHGVTSISNELGHSVTIDEVKPLVKDAFYRVFTDPQ